MAARFGPFVPVVPGRMRQNIHAVTAALVVAIVAGLPLSAAAILQTTAAHDALVARRAAELGTVLASADARAAVIAAAADATRIAEGAVAARADVDPIAALVARTAATVSETTIPFRDLAVTLRRGEDWESVADQWGLSGTQLAALNPTVDINRLRAGDRVRVYRFHPELPSSSRGNPARGRVLNAMPMPDGPHWIVRDLDRAWGTTQTVSALVRGFTHTAEVLPEGGRPLVGDISYRRGGRMQPHRSHASGRDVDVTYFRTEAADTDLFERTRSTTIDAARQWELFRYWIERGEAKYIFIDHRLSRALYEHAVSLGEDPALLEEAFGHPRGSGILRYAPGHDDHFHVRFHCADGDEACDDV